MTTTDGPCEPDTAVRRVAAEILAGYRGYIRELRLEVVEGGVVIRGRALSFYGKQIALHEVTRRVGKVVANEIEVQLSLTEP